MSNSVNLGTNNIPLQFAKQLTAIVNEEWENGSFIQKVSPITQDLLRFWFSPTFCDERSVNFHKGQKQAILNVIYCYEILKTKSVIEMYQAIGNGIVDDNFLKCINKEKFFYPKYCVKMATGTGKTWCMNAIFLWQYLNAKYNENKLCSFTKNFLFIAPGLIVYDRLLDSFLGKEDINGIRNFETSDLKRNQDIFIPEKYRDAVFNFVQNNVVKKEEIGKKITSDAIIVILNWHKLMGADDIEREEEGIKDLDTDVSPLKNPSKIVNDLLPIKPGTTSGHSLDSLDNNFLNGGELEYLQSLPNICVFNDEAHHIHENKSADAILEVEWQKALNYISKNKENNFIQIDFSATPYDAVGSGNKKIKHYFPHIIVDYGLNLAIKAGLVKVIAIDKRKEIASLPNEDLDFKAIRDGNEVIGLSKGQRLMLKAGLARLELLENEFTKVSQYKHPKMLVVCEDTKVSPLVVEFLIQNGVNENDVIQIDSNKKGSINQEDWAKVKQDLFAIDKKESPKVIVSVLMLREGFDVNNICVIVPLRSSQAPILLEQVIGRGLRLMWREPEYIEIKAEDRHKMLNLKQEPSSYYDILHIVEHPAYIQFYEDLDDDLIYEEKEEIKRENVLGDIITVDLKENYEDYDFYIPIIVRDKEELLTTENLSVKNLEKLDGFTLEQLKGFLDKDDGEIFLSQEMLVKTIFGEYKVNANLFDTRSYNEFLSKIIQIISSNIGHLSLHSIKDFPTLQVNQNYLMGVIDEYIRNKLFGQPFNPMEGNNWRILMLNKINIIEHIIKEISKVINNLQNNIEVEDAIVIKKYFSEVKTLKMRKNFCLDITKSIYKKTAYPSNKGEFEREFLLFADADSEVEKLLKINENYHTFASLRYIRSDGMFSSYYPDFIVKIADNIYLVETKARKDINQENVIQKQRGALDWIKKINQLSSDDRMNSVWHYAILDDNTFYLKKSNNERLDDILKYCELNNSKVEGILF